MASVEQSWLGNGMLHFGLLNPDDGRVLSSTHMNLLNRPGLSPGHVVTQIRSVIQQIAAALCIAFRTHGDGEGAQQARRDWSR